MGRIAREQCEAQRAFVTTGLKRAREGRYRTGDVVFDRFSNVCDCWRVVLCQRAVRLGGITRRCAELPEVQLPNAGSAHAAA